MSDDTQLDFIDCARYNELDELRAYLAAEPRHVDIDGVDERGNTALVRAVPPRSHSLSL